MKSKNVFVLRGVCASKPDIITTQSGKLYTTIKLVTSYYVKSNTSKPTQVSQWHSIKAWGNLAQIANNLIVKGSLVEITGSLNPVSYSNGNNGKVFTIDLVASKLDVTPNTPNVFKPKPKPETVTS